MQSIVKEARDAFLSGMCDELFGRKTPDGPFTAADGSNTTSVAIAAALADELVESGFVPTDAPETKPQTVGTTFSVLVASFLRRAFANGFTALLPGEWEFEPEARLSDYSQFAHLTLLDAMHQDYRDAEDWARAAATGGDYHVKHDVVMSRVPDSPEQLRQRPTSSGRPLLDPAEPIATRTILRDDVQTLPIIHAAISTKWTLRSDRAQNVRTEALNLLKHRKGRTPHMVAVTCEVLPSRLASLAVGTGEIDCVYHAALDELIRAVGAVTSPAAMKELHPSTRRSRAEQAEDLEVLVAGRQLRDIADLPFDLAT